MGYMKKRRKDTAGGLFIEILCAFVLVVIVLIPLMGGFTTSVRQTQAAKSYVSAHAIGTWAMAQAKTLVDHGLATPETAADLTSEVRQQLPKTAAQLRELRVLRSMKSIGSTGRCFGIGITVSWHDPKVKRTRVRRFQTIARSEI